MSIEFLTKVDENGTIFLPEEYRYFQSQLVKVQLTEQGKEETVHIFSWYERVVLDEIIGDGVRILISENDQDIEQEEYLSFEQYRRLVELAPHEPIIKGDVYLIKYERLNWDDDDKSQFVIKKVQRITEQAMSEIIDLHKHVFGKREELHHKKAVDNIVPAELMEKYHELSDRRLRGKLTRAEDTELQQVEQEIEKIEENHPVLQLFDQQEERRHQQMIKSLEDIGNKLKTLIETV